eukprot:399980-Rhodomonas_salina.1
MPWPTSTPLESAALPVVDVLESLTEQLVRTALLHAGLDPDCELLARHCRPRARRAALGPRDIDASPLDLFYYPNADALRHISNCTPHYDPGFLAVS